MNEDPVAGTDASQITEGDLRDHVGERQRGRGLEVEIRREQGHSIRAGHDLGGHCAAHETRNPISDAELHDALADRADDTRTLAAQSGLVGAAPEAEHPAHVELRERRGPHANHHLARPWLRGGNLEERDGPLPAHLPRRRVKRGGPPIEEACAERPAAGRATRVRSAPAAGPRPGRHAGCQPRRMPGAATQRELAVTRFRVESVHQLIGLSGLRPSGQIDCPKCGARAAERTAEQGRRAPPLRAIARQPARSARHKGSASPARAVDAPQRIEQA
jgi:hypothetical protein